ncbi:MAG TPA: cytochrome P450 [Acidimicrobiia bacterium]|jgi:cytochrome P450
MAYDIAEATDFFHGQPYAMWADEREKAPVLAMGMYGDDGGCQIIDWQHAEAVLRDAATFSSSINMQHIGQFMGELIVGLDGEEHRTYRNLVAKAFRQSQLEKWDDTLVRPLIEQLVDEVAPKGRAELVADITAKYPVQVICGIAGVPIADAEQFAQWAVEINTGPLDPPKGFAAKKAMTDYLQPLIDARRANPTGDFLSDLVHAEVDGEQLRDERLWGFLRLLLPAGAETTYRVLGSALYALLSHPDVMTRVQADPSLIPAVVEETLRWETSVTMVSRVATRDTEVGGCPIHKGEPVGVATGAANHDGTRFEHPEKFDIDRPPALHLAFGTGPHQCLGMHLARLELNAALEVILARLPNLRFDPDDGGAAPLVEGLAFRGPNRLPVVFG